MKFLHTTGQKDIIELEGELPEMQSNQIMIKTIMCGVCRSDIAAYAGWEKPMPEMHFGHEGLGKVIAIGEDVKKDVKLGDIVSTWSDPAYAEQYYAKENEFTIVPEAHHKYILQPVACAMNIILKTLSYPQSIDENGILLLGSGFMSIIIGQYAKSAGIKLTVCGQSNKKHWEKTGIELCTMTEILSTKKKYKAIIDLTSKADNFYIITEQLADLEALICYASTPFTEIHTNFFDNCWNCHTFIMPSPRNSDFSLIMDLTCTLIKKGILQTEFIWSAEYNRHNMTDVKQAFEDGINRSETYLRGYLKF